MEETQQILIKMGFKNTNWDVWHSDWFGSFLLVPHSTPEDLAKFIYNRGVNHKYKLQKEWAKKLEEIKIEMK